MTELWRVQRGPTYAARGGCAWDNLWLHPRGGGAVGALRREAADSMYRLGHRVSA